MQAIKGAVKRYVAENMSDRAAALTYYSVLSLFPALIAVIALVGVFGSIRKPRTRFCRSSRRSDHLLRLRPLGGL